MSSVSTSDNSSAPVAAATPLAGLASTALADGAIGRVQDSVGRTGVDIVAPVAARPFVAAALADRTQLLLVTATGREADDLTTELQEIFGDGVAQFP